MCTYRVEGVWVFPVFGVMVDLQASTQQSNQHSGAHSDQQVVCLAHCTSHHDLIKPIA